MQMRKHNLKRGFYASLQWPIWMVLILVVANVFVYLQDRTSGYIVSGVLLLYIVACIFFYMYRRKTLLKDLIEYGSDYAQIQKNLLTEMKVPYAMCDERGRFLWANRAFSGLVNDKEFKKKTLFSLFGTEDGHLLPRDGEDEAEADVVREERNYHLTAHRIAMTNLMDEMTRDVDRADIELFAIYLYDTTEILQTRKLYQDNKQVVALIYMDNYEEALENLEDVRKSLLVALVDRKITQYFSEYHGILRKLEKDKYLYIGTMEYLPAMKENRFSVLEEAKSVNIGNDMSVTISIGVGINGESAIQNYEYARTAIDLALGRGGDQAVVKNGKSVEYFGGKTHTLEKTTRVKARVKAHALRELIETKEKVLIMGHHFSDVDCIGAAVGVYRAAKHSGKRAYIVLERVGPAEKPLIDRFADNPDYEPNLFIKSEDALAMAGGDTVLVIVDVNRPSYTECPQLVNAVKNVVIIDHHRQTDERVENAVLSYIEPYASSACEMVAEILQYYAEDLKVKPLDADALYSGIVMDTSNFLNKTGIRTFEAAAFLRRSGADVTRVRKMFRDDMQEYKIRANTINHAEVFCDNFTIGICAGHGCDNLNVVAAQAANELLNIRGIQASFVLADFNGKIYISARSIDEVNVQIIMEKLGGGGHMSVAGAQLAGISIDSAYDLVKNTVIQMRENGEI